MNKSFFNSLMLGCLLLTARAAQASAYGTPHLPQLLPWQQDAQQQQAQIRVQTQSAVAVDSDGVPILRLELTRAPCHLPTDLRRPLGNTALSQADLLGSELRDADYVAMRTFVGLHAGSDVEIYTLIGKSTARWSKLDVEIDARQQRLIELRYFDASQTVVRRLVCAPVHDRLGAHAKAAQGSCTLYSELPAQAPVSRIAWFRLTPAGRRR